jgi:hypothetical protein
MRMHTKAWIILVFVCTSCGRSFQNKYRSEADSLRKIFISPDQVYDLSGYAGKGFGNPFNLFDENAYVDPRYEQAADAFTPVTNCQPTSHSAIYFRGTTGNRIITDLKIPYLIREIYYFDHSQTADSFWIYTGNLRKWKLVSSSISVSQPGSRGWKKITLDEETRFVMIRFSSNETEITEMVFYGIPQNNVPLPENYTKHKGLTRIPLNRFLGVNYVMEDEPRWLKPFYYSRMYNFALDYDTDTAKDEKDVQFNMLHYGYYNREKKKYIFSIDTLQRIQNGNIWFSIRGVSKWMNDLHYSDKDRPMNKPDMNPEDPSSYSRHAKMMWHLAAFFGSQHVDTNLLSLSHGPRISGRGSMSMFENGNEEDANWVGNKYCSPIEYFALSTADWDGDEGRLGACHGIHRADPKSLLMMSGLTGLDTSRVKVYRFLSENLRDDHQFIWQAGIQYHYYAQNGKAGISPEQDSMRSKLSKVADCSFRIDPLVKCFLGENGYDKSTYSKQATPFIPGMTASQSQGVMLLRSINATFFSGFDAYILYWLRDRNLEDDPRVYLTSGILETRSDGSTKVFPGWYYISTLVNRLGNFIPDKIISESGDVWIYRYRQIQKPDSVAYFIYKPTVNGSSVLSYELKTETKGGSSAEQINFSDDSDSGISEKLQIARGKIRLKVKELPILILCKEPGGDK